MIHIVYRMSLNFQVSVEVNQMRPGSQKKLPSKVLTTPHLSY